MDAVAEPTWMYSRRVFNLTYPSLACIRLYSQLGGM